MAERTPTSVERELHKALAGRRLAGELRLSEEELDELEHHVKELVQSGMSANGLARAVPALLVTYLTAVGVYRYAGGTFWPNVPVADRLRSSAMGTAFKNAVESLGLRSFDDLVAGEGATEYVARILAHGGIPRYCLSDFFGALHAGIRQAGSADDLLSLWRTRPERLAHLDKPIGRFLRYGGDEARDLLVRCTELVDETLARGTVPASDEVGLPEFLVEDYAVWRRRSATSHPAGRKVSVARPRVEIDPWGATGPHLVLPAFGDADSWWSVAGDGRAPLGMRTSDVREQFVRLEPSRSWDVSLASGGVVVRLFTFEAFGELPVLLFDPDSGLLVRDPLNIRLEQVISLFPADATLEALSSDGSSLGSPREIERYPSPTGEWRGFNLGRLDLEGVARLRVIHDEVERVVRVAAPASRPALVGDAVPGVTTADGRAVFSGFPRINVPEDLRGFEWSARVRRRGEVVAQKTVRADAEGYLDVMPEDSFGEFDIHVTGVLGFDVQERVAVVPELAIRRPDDLLFPHDVNASIAVSVQPGLVIDDIASRARIVVPDDRDTAALRVSDGSSQVALFVQFARVVWGVVAEAGSGAGLSGDVLRLDALDVEQGRARALVLRTGRSGLLVHLRLSSRDGVLQESDAGETREEGRWAFDLRPFQDAVRLSGDPVLRLELAIGPRIVHVADVVVRYTASEIRSASRAADDFTEVVLSFSESGVVNSRVARLWSLDRPWEDAIEESIPDGQAGQAVISGYSRIPVGPYLAQVAVDDGWTRRTRPLLQAPSTGRVVVGDRQAWRARVDQLDSTDALQALEIVVTDGYVSDETLDEIDFGEVASEALSTFVWMLANSPRGEPLAHGTNAIRKALLDSFDGCLRALVAAPESGVPDEALRRIELFSLRGFDKYSERTAAVAGALDDDELRAVWRVAPALAATVDLAVRDNSPSASERLLQQLGSTGDELPTLSGFRIDPMLLGLPSEQLRGIADVLEIYPGPLLERRSLEAACFELLLAESEFDASEDLVRPSQWFEAHGDFVRPLLHVPGYRDALAPRLARKGDLPWAGLPATTLAAAIHVRRRTAQWVRATRALDEALCFAPALVRHDLIASNLRIARLRAEGQPC